MSFDSQLADRIKRAFSTHPLVTEKAMFGGLCFIIDGHRCIGIVGDDLMVRVGPAEYERALEEPHVRQMDFTGRPMRGYVYVEPEGCSTVKSLGRWVETAVAFVSTLPRKVPKSRARGRAVTIALAVMAMSVTSLAQSTMPSVCTADPQPAALDFVMKDLAGKDVPLSAFRGKVLLLNFWATWCIPCKIEIPAFNELQKQYRRRGVEIVGINVGESDTAVALYSREVRIDYSNLLAGARKDLLDAFDVDIGLPTTVVVGRDGRVCRRRVGLTRKDTFELLIKALL